MKIRNANVLVTGANRGLGRALVKAALERGATRVYAGVRDLGGVEDLVREAESRVVPVALDITKPSSLALAAQRAPDVTLLINNAGVLASGSLLSSDEAAIAREFATNVFGTVATSSAFIPTLTRAAAAREAAIVNVLSVASLANLPSMAAYSASKAAAHSLTQALRAELAGRRIRVHGVFAGSIDTDMLRGVDIPKSQPEEVARGIFDGVEAGSDDIYPDPMSEQIFATWRRDPKELERQFAGMLG